MSRELTTTDQHRSARCDMATHAPRSNMGAVGHNAGGVRKRTGPLPPLNNLVEMEKAVDAYRQFILCGLVFVGLPVALGFIMVGLCDLLGG
jgi:hypothetical protein